MSEDDNEYEACATALDHATVIGVDMRRVIRHECGDVLLHHKDYVPMDVSAMRKVPGRVRGTVTHEVYKSLATYVNLHQQVNSAIYHSTVLKQILAVIDHHDNTLGPAWGQHLAVYTGKHSPAYAAWKAIDGKQFSQESFAQFIEDHIADIIVPNSAVVLEVIETLIATMSGQFRRAIRRENGTVSLAYDETVDAKAGVGGSLDVPRKLEVSVACFEGGPKYKLPMHLRYKIGGGSVAWSVAIPGVVEFERQAWFELVELFTAALAPDVRESIPIYCGTPKA